MSVQNDRREAQAQRIPFDLPVTIGGVDDPSGAFEAAGVDVSTGGMHVRTLYLPDLGQPLTCRFDAAGQEIAVEGDVVWRDEGPRGGEFGIRFQNVDGASTAALLEMCGIQPAASDGSAAPGLEAPMMIATGTRVRLHIDGLGAPMKARVREGGTARVLVGSNLEFLRVGRALEVEDVDQQRKRSAHVDRVEVQIDPASRVPQLVVSLRYTDAEGEEAVADEPHHEMAPSAAPFDPPVVAPLGRSAADATADPADDDEVDAARQMKSRVSRAAQAVTPAMARLGKRAAMTASLLWAKTRGRPMPEVDVPARRTTAPPPTGGLHAAGKHIVRDEELDAGFDTTARRPTTARRALAFGGAAGIVAMLVMFAVRRSPAPPPAAAAPVEGEATTAALTDPTLAADPLAAADAGATPTATTGAVAQANVPLFGATPMSTTEPAAVPPPVAALGATPDPFAAVPSVDGGALPTEPAALAAAPAEEPAAAHASPSEDEDRGSAPSHAHVKVASFGHGKVSHPTVLRVKMDGTITALQGGRTATGFTVTLPGRHAAESLGGLASKDARIASVRGGRGGKGAEVSFSFKDGVPPFQVRASGHDLVVALGRGADAAPAKGEPRGTKVAKGHDAKDGKLHATASKGSRAAGHKTKKSD